MSNSGLEMAEIGALIGDPARANMLIALADGRALTAGELAYVARVTPQTTSGHLAKLLAANLLALARQGRHRYYRLASPLVAEMLENVMAVAAFQLPPRRHPPSRLDDEMQLARTCYDHLAGRLGVGLAEALTARGQIVLTEDGGELTATGQRFFAGFGADLVPAKGARRRFCRACLDWSERRWHIAGTVGAALCRRCFELGWIERRSGSRAVAITAEGRRGLAEVFGLSLADQPNRDAAVPKKRQREFRTPVRAAFCHRDPDRTRSSPHYRYRAPGARRNQNDTRNQEVVSCPIDLEFAQTPDIEFMRISGSRHSSLRGVPWAIDAARRHSASRPRRSRRSTTRRPALSHD